VHVFDETRRTSFDRSAELYDAARPSYPEALADDLLARTGARRVLEIGAGTGKATRVFARRGCAITAIEPGARMAAVLRRNVAGHDVTVVESRFEDWRGPEHDLVLAAQAFHWIEPATRCLRTAAAAPWLAVVTNETASLDPPLRAELDAAYARWIPAKTATSDLDAVRAGWVDEIAASGRYGPVHVGQFPWHTRYSRPGYLDLLATYSDHAVLPAPDRAALFEAIGAAIDRRGGSIEVSYTTMALVARRTP
jgi:SAM-dependent methyltransferase